jgi:hypothetical protein
VDSGDFDLVPPDPAALSESLRAFGYSLQTAVADIVDNSITAGATKIRIEFEWAGGSSWVAIRDNGDGMSPDELVQAMRPGSRHPSFERPKRDLGRFGLGLKTASFSQCRRLSVSTLRRGGSPARRCWDLDEISASGQWRLLRRLAPETEQILDTMVPAPHGTVILWDRLDRMVEPDAEPDDAAAHDRFNDLIDEVAKHLRMVFERFLAGPRRIGLFVNGNRLAAWDPFTSDHAATQVLPAQHLSYQGHTITLRGYVLPHHSKLSSKEHDEAGGARGWNEHQGFYIYRENRLLVAGGWLGLFRQEEHYKLARVAIEVPNALDGAWGIDVRKSRATPPGPLRAPLRAYAKVVRERAVEVYRFRGKIIARSTTQDHIFGWTRRNLRGRVTYRINRHHPLVRECLRGSSGDAVSATISLLEETLPVEAIQIDSAEDPDNRLAPFEEVSAGELSLVLSTVYRTLRVKHDDQAAKEIMITMEGIGGYPTLIAALSDTKAEES